MCNLYSVTKGQAAIRQAARAMVDHAGNLPLLSGVYPDTAAPIIRTGPDGRRELVTARWGMPTPPSLLAGKQADRGVTNVRNTSSPHWRRWLGPGARCLVPVDAFAEWSSGRNVWFALGEDRPLMWFAGIWTRWTGVRKVKEGEITTDLFAFLTTEPSEPVRTYHPKAMPVVLTQQEEMNTWLSAPAPIALELQRPLPSGRLQVLAETDPRHARATVGFLG